MTEIRNPYGERSLRFAKKRDRYENRSRAIQHGRLVSFLAAIVCLALVETTGSLSALFKVGAVSFGIGFITLVIATRQTAARVRWYEELRRVNHDAEQRLERNWNAMAISDVVEQLPKEHPYAADLDLFGRASLFQLICTASTPPGRETLRDWLLKPATHHTIVERQEAVAELAPLLDLRDELAARGRLVGELRRQPFNQFVEWTKERPSLQNKWGWIWASRLIPLSTILFAGLNLQGVIAYPLWMIPLLAGLLATWSTHTVVHKIFRRASSGEPQLRRLATVFRILSTVTFKTPLLRRLQRDLLADGIDAGRQMRRLGRVLACADLRYSELLYFAVQPITMWDFHVLFALEKWQRDAGRHASRWMDCLGQVEALSALAALAYTHPTWTFPEFSADGDTRIKAVGLGHPLLRPSDCVTNDVQIGPVGTVLFVTGSNMSGKSTLLKTVGVNVTLAHAGGPVCASRLRLPSVKLCTSMHVRDSLEDGVSQFMAQLRQLKYVVDMAREARSDGSIVLYLLDEILQGTNTAERQTAIRNILRHLLRENAVGAISSHDLALCNTNTLQPVTHSVHFREEIRVEERGPALQFDYKLRSGVATSTNALKLMEIVGLGNELRC